MSVSSLSCKPMRGAGGGAAMLVMIFLLLLLLLHLQLSMASFLPTATTTNSRHAFIHGSSSFISSTPSSPSSTTTTSTTSSFTTSSTSSSVGGPTNTRTTLSMSDDASPLTPTSFREAEVLGLKFMQEGNYEDALKAFQQGLRCPGSRQDVIRTKSLSGPSPVGGSMGGFDSQAVNTLDEFEMQAAHYNMACAHAQLGNAVDAVANLKVAFEQGFDNYATVRGDPDLAAIRSTPQFEKLMQQYDPKKNSGGIGGGSIGGFNPFGLFGGGGGNK